MQSPNSENSVKKAWRYIGESPLLLTIVSAFLIAVYSVMDNFILKNVIVSNNGFQDSLVYLLIGGWVGSIVNWILVSVAHKELVLPRMHIHKFAALKSGFLAAIGTACYLYANTLSDPFILIALGNLTILYTAGFDIRRHHLPFWKVLGPALMATSGVFILAISHTGSITNWLLTIALAALGYAGLGAIGEYIDQGGIQDQEEFEYGVARFFYLTLWGTGICLVLNITNLVGYFTRILSSLTYWPTWVTVGIGMFCVFFGQGLKLKAKNKARVGFVVMVSALQVVFGFLITILATYGFERLFHVLPFGQIPTDTTTWVFRAIGAIVLLTAIGIMWMIDDKLKR